jgi:hypothetical protein
LSIIQFNKAGVMYAITSDKSMAFCGDEICVCKSACSGFTGPISQVIA